MSNQNLPKEGKEKKNESLSSVRKSIWGELNATSTVAIIVMAVIIIASVAAFIFMNIKPEKHVFLMDDAHIFSVEELEQLDALAEKLKKECDINVVIATTRNNPKGTSDADCKNYAKEIYQDCCISTPLQDNSGFCLYIDLTVDKPGSRFFWLYTYGTAYYSVSDEECQSLFSSHRDELSNEQYYEALSGIMRRLINTDFHSDGLTFIYCLCALIPLILALLITWICTFRKNLDKVPGSNEYIVRKECMDIENRDDFIRKTTQVYHTSSSSGGGGGGGHGGGGGGHSGGGGGRF